MPLRLISPKEKMYFGQCANERKKEHLRVLPEDAPFFAVQTALRIKTYLKNDEYALLTAAVRSVSDVRKRSIIFRYGKFGRLIYFQIRLNLKRCPSKHFSKIVP